jgi:ATP-dependent DNA ligase
MYALALQHIPEGKEWLYEVKFDGYRGLAKQRCGRSNALVASRKSFHDSIFAYRPRSVR